MKTDTTSTAEPSPGAAPSPGRLQPASGAQANPRETVILPPRAHRVGAPVSVRRTDSSNAHRHRSEIALPPGHALKRLVGNLVLAVVVLGTLGSGGYHLYRWYSESLRDHAIDSVLVSIRSRQRQYERMNQAYAGSLSALKMKLPPEQMSQARVIAGSIGGFPSFIAEFCDGVSCKTIDATGRIRPALQVSRPTGAGTLPELKAGSGRIYGFGSSEPR